MWSLYNKKKKLKPLVFSNGKTQYDIVKEIIKAIKKGSKLIFIKGICGTGKSAIALNLAKELGKTSIVVPIKSLQKQYEEDYTNNMHILKKNKEKLKISLITGRNNHKCLFNDLRADNNKLPCTIEIKEENKNELKEYIRLNPFVEKEDFKDINDIKRFSIAPSCPYWSPILPEEFKVSMFKDHKFKTYTAINNIKYKILINKKCSYYSQFESYIDSDVIIFNSMKYELENAMNRKPLTELEIIDECDKFLDDLANQKSLNLERLSLALTNLKSYELKENIEEINNLIIKIIKGERIRRYSESDVYLLKDTLILELLEHFLDNDELKQLLELEDYSYVSKAFDAAKTFEKFFDETYLYFYKDRNKHICIRLVTINLEKRLKELLDKNKVFVMMSGTIHSKEVLQNIFGVKDFVLIDAETQNQGKIIKVKTGMERDFRYRNFMNGTLNRKDYLLALSECVSKAEKPVLVQVNSFRDLPDSFECKQFNITNLKTQEEVKENQEKYRKGELVSEFKKGKTDILFSTQCIRGVDFPGKVCNSIIFTKYPFPAANDLFWKVLRKTKPQHYWMFYNDKAKREFLQRLYRGLRFKDDKVNLLSPDLRVFV